MELLNMLKVKYAHCWTGAFYCCYHEKILTHYLQYVHP